MIFDLRHELVLLSHRGRYLTLERELRLVFVHHLLDIYLLAILRHSRLALLHTVRLVLRSRCTIRLGIDRLDGRVGHQIN